MEKSTFNEQPKLLVNEGKKMRVNFDVEESTTEREVASTDKDGKEITTTEKVTDYLAYVVRVAHPLGADKVVSAIVEAAYPSDKMQAIINNHFVNLAVIADGGTLDDDEARHETEYKAMQEWRTHAKSIATDVMEAYNKGNY